jgi:hypothetical protein
MALIEEQQADKEQEIYFNFVNSLKSPVTKETYDINIKRYLKFCDLAKLSELLAIQKIETYCMHCFKKAGYKDTNKPKKRSKK